MTYEKLIQELKSAKEYVNRIGESQPHFRDGSVGELRSLIVATEIHHQRVQGGTNYHRDSNFDKALAEVIKNNFPDLAGEALILMEARANTALITEELHLRERLRLIEETKEKLLHD